MDAKELRIGNFVMQSDQVYSELPHQIVQVGDFPVLQNEKCQVISEIKFVNPIPLTKEWLLKFGFEEQARVFTVYYKGRFNVYKPAHYVNWFFCEGNVILREIKYAHTFQNIYFALTGEELIYNERKISQRL